MAHFLHLISVSFILHLFFFCMFKFLVRRKNGFTSPSSLKYGKTDAHLLKMSPEPSTQDNLLKHDWRPSEKKNKNRKQLYALSLLFGIFKRYTFDLKKKKQKLRYFHLIESEACPAPSSHEQSSLGLLALVGHMENAMGFLMPEVNFNWNF